MVRGVGRVEYIQKRWVIRWLSITSACPRRLPQTSRVQVLALSPACLTMPGFHLEDFQKETHPARFYPDPLGKY